MAIRSETLGRSRRAPRAAWIMLFAIVVVAAALAIGTLVRSDDAARPVRPSNQTTAGALEPATQVPGLVKAGLQPRPYSRIPVASVEDTAPTVSDGSATMPGGELRRKFG